MPTPISTNAPKSARRFTRPFTSCPTAIFLTSKLAPHLLGSAARGAFDLGELTDMQQRVNCELRDLRRIGDDLRLTLTLET